MAGALIGALRVSLSAETSAFEAGMKRSQRTAQTTANSIVSSFKQAGGATNLAAAGIKGFIASLSVGTIIAAGKASLDYAASLGETAEQLGVTTRELQNFRAAAAQNGASTEQADKALEKLSLSISKAQSGSKEAAAAFKSVGLSIQDLNGSKWEVIGKIADGMVRQGGASKNAAAGVAIFGKGFQKIIPTLDQGSAGINQLADANERLGGVLSDTEIQNADKTADKLEQLSNVLKAKIASDVAANSNAIAQFASFLFELANAAIAAKNAINEFIANYNIPNLLFGGKTFGFNRPGKSVTVPIGPSVRTTPRIGGGGPPRFLGGGGGSRSRRGGGRDDAERKRQQQLREENQFDQEIRRAKIDVLNATRDLATDAVERYAISIQIKDAEKAAFEADLQYQVAAGERTKAQADALKLEHDRVDQLERDKLIAEEQHRAFEESARLDDLQFDLERDRLESEAQLAENAKDERDVRLRLLDLAYRQERARLNTILADEQASEAAKEEARQRLANLNRTFGNDRQGVINNTRGPLEDFQSRFSDINDELEQLTVDGIGGAVDALTHLTEGWDSFRDAAVSAIKQVIAELVRLQLMKFAANIIGAAAGAPGAGGLGGASSLGGGLASLGAFATGGFVSGPGSATSDSIPALLSNGEFVMNSGAVRNFGLPFFNAINSGQLTPEMLGGQGHGGGSKGILGKAAGLGFFGAAGLLATGSKLPIFGVLGKLLHFSEGGYVDRGISIPRSSYAQRIGITNDNPSMRSGMTVPVSVTVNGNASRETVQQIEYGVRRAVARASRTYG